MRRGNIFLVGLLIIYIGLAIFALVILTDAFFSAPPESIGTYQAALLDTMQQADEKRLYLEDAGGLALQEAYETLYTDFNQFFGTTYGDAESGCKYYGYPLAGGCMPLDQKALRKAIEESLPRVLFEKLDPHLRAYPPGPFVYAFTNTMERDSGVRVQFIPRSRMEESIYLHAPAEGAVPSKLAVGAVPELAWPQQAGNAQKRVTSCFGPRFGNRHKGMDMGAYPPGSTPSHISQHFPVTAAAPGKVIYVNRGGMGTVWVRHSNKLSTRYLHLENIFVTVGQIVESGEPLGYTGAQGTTDAHLHFEVLLNQSVVEGVADHAYPSNVFPGWVAVNPGCFLSEEAKEGAQVKPPGNRDNTCARDPFTAYCDEYEASEDGERVATYPILTRNTLPEQMQEEQSAPEELPEKLEKTRTRLEGLDIGTANGLEYATISAKQHGIPASLLLGIITQESMGCPRAISPTGPAGIGQFYTLAAEDYIDDTYPFKACKGECSKVCNAPECDAARCRQALESDECRCTEDDPRFDPARALPGAARFLQENMEEFDDKTEQLRFAIAAYNAGRDGVKAIIAATGKDDPSWKECKRVLREHPEVTRALGSHFSTPQRQQAKAEEIIDYVERVYAYASAWNSGTPLDTLVAGRREVEKIGTYTWDADFSITAEDHFTPFENLMSWTRSAVEACASMAENPSRRNFYPEFCMLFFAASSQPPITIAGYEEQLTGIKSLLYGVNPYGLPRVSAPCEEPGVRYFQLLFQAIHDCSENGQWDCDCPLPEPPRTGERRRYTLAFDLERNTARLTREGQRVAFPVYENLSTKPLRVLANKAHLTLEQTDAVTLHLETGEEPKTSISIQRKGESDGVTWENFSFIPRREPPYLSLSPETVGEQCAQVKRRYMACATPDAEMPPVKWSFEINDAVPPQPPSKPPKATVLRDPGTPQSEAEKLLWKEYVRTKWPGTSVEKDAYFDPVTGNVTLINSESPDIAYYNIYLFAQAGPFAGPTSGLMLPLTQARPGEGPCFSFSLEPFAQQVYPGTRLLVTAVDRAGIENTEDVLPLEVSPWWRNPRLLQATEAPLPDEYPAANYPPNPGLVLSTGSLLTPTSNLVTLPNELEQHWSRVCALSGPESGLGALSRPLFP